MERLLVVVNAVLPEPVGASGGVRVWCPTEQDVDGIIAKADQATYEAKRRNRKRRRVLGQDG